MHTRKCPVGAASTTTTSSARKRCAAAARRRARADGHADDRRARRRLSRLPRARLPRLLRLSAAPRATVTAATSESYTTARTLSRTWMETAFFNCSCDSCYVCGGADADGCTNSDDGATDITEMVAMTTRRTSVGAGTRGLQQRRLQLGRGVLRLRRRGRVDGLSDERGAHHLLAADIDPDIPAGRRTADGWRARREPRPPNRWARARRTAVAKLAATRANRAKNPSPLTTVV